MEKNILIQFTIICGEFEFDSHSFISVDSKATRRQINSEVKKFMKSYWDNGEWNDLLNGFEYCGGQLMSKRADWSVITNKQLEVLRAVGLNKGH